MVTMANFMLKICFTVKEFHEKEDPSLHTRVLDKLKKVNGLVIYILEEGSKTLLTRKKNDLYKVSGKGFYVTVSWAKLIFRY